MAGEGGARGCLFTARKRFGALETAPDQERYLGTVALQRSPPAHHLNHHGSYTYEGASLTVRSGGVALDLQGLFEVLNCRRQRPTP